MSSLPLYRCQTESQPSYTSPDAEAQRGLMGQQYWTQCTEFPEGTVSEGHEIRFYVTRLPTNCGFENALGV